MVLRDVATRRFSTAIPSLYIAFVTAVLTAAVAGLVALIRDWQPMTASGLGLLAISACFLVFGYLFSIKAMRVGEVARSEEHTSELQSLMRISYAVFCLNKKKTYQATTKRDKTYI